MGHYDKFDEHFSRQYNPKELQVNNQGKNKQDIILPYVYGDILISYVL